MLDLWKRSITTSGWRLSGNYNDEENNIAANIMSTHSAITNSVNPFQVVVMNEYHVALRYALCDSS